MFILPDGVYTMVFILMVFILRMMFIFCIRMVFIQYNWNKKQYHLNLMGNIPKIIDIINEMQSWVWMKIMDLYRFLY